MLHISHTVLFRCVEQCSVCVLAEVCFIFEILGTIQKTVLFSGAYKTEYFLHMLFLKNKARIDKNHDCEQCFSCENKSVCQKLAQS